MPPVGKPLNPWGLLQIAREGQTAVYIQIAAISASDALGRLTRVLKEVSRQRCVEQASHLNREPL